MPSWASLGETRWRFGLADCMENSFTIADEDDGVAELTAVFRELDADGSGSLDKEEVHYPLALSTHTVRSILIPFYLFA